MSISNHLNKIKNAIYGKDVRGAIHDAIKQVYDDASVNHDNANMEVKLARGTHTTLNDRLNKSDQNLAQTNAQLSRKANFKDVRLNTTELDINDFNESSRNILMNQEGQINAVLGGQNVTKDNIKVGDIQSYNIKGCNPINVFDKDKATYGKYLYSSGVVGTNANFCYSDYIPCCVNDYFEIIGVNGANNNGGICGGVIYNNLKNVIGFFSTYKPEWATTQGSSGWNNIYTITQEDACFVRFNVLSGDVDNTKMITKNYPYRNEDGSITPFVAYGKSKIEWLDLDDIHREVEDINHIMGEVIDNLEDLSDLCENSFGKTYEEIPNVIGADYYGFANRIKAPRLPISKIVLYTKSMTIDADYQCKILDDTRKIVFGYSTARSKKNDGTGEYIAFDFDEIVVEGDNIYVSIYSDSSDLKITSAGGDIGLNNAIGTATEDYPNYYAPSPTSVGNPGNCPNPKTGYYMAFEVVCSEKTAYNANCSIGIKHLSDEVKEYIKKDAIEKKDLDLFLPNKIYTWGNGIDGDFNGNRVPKVGIYLDHMIPYNTSDLDIKFDDVSQKNRLEFTTPYPIDWTVSKVNDGVNMKEIDVNYTVSGTNYNAINGVIKHISVRNDVGADKHVALLTIGDSTVEGANAFITLDDGTAVWSPFWHEVARQFAMDSIEVNDTNKYKFTALGVRSGKGGNDTVEYLGKTRTIVTATNGESGSKLADHLRYVSQKRPSQEVWDLLGLGDGSGSDYKGTSEQRDLIAQTCEVYNGAEVDFNGNPFFDNSKTGDNRFSITKWLERYRTMNDDGTRLTLGDGTGTKITNDNINKINVCTPTHVLLQTGLNDWSQVSVEQYLKDMDIFVREVKSQLPKAKIAITLFADDPGTFFKELYPNIKDCDMRYLHDKTRPYITALFNHFKDSTDVELLPFYFVMPPAVSLSYRWIQNDDGTKVKVPFGPASNDYHANGYAHKTWSHQLYAWIKSTLV